MRAPARGPLAGTTGNQAPSFPVGSSAEAARTAIVGPVVTLFDAEDQQASDRAPVVGTAGAEGSAVTAAPATGVSSLQRPTGLNAVFIIYRGTRWRPAGAPVEFSDARFRAVEDYLGFPVFVARGGTRSESTSHPGPEWLRRTNLSESQLRDLDPIVRHPGKCHDIA